MDYDTLMFTEHAIAESYIVESLRYRIDKPTVKELAKEYHFWLDSIKAQAWEEGYRAHITRVGINENPYKGENN